MRVLILSHNWPRFPFDPAGAFVARIAEGVARHGVEVRVLTPHVRGTPHQESASGVSVERFRYAPEHRERIGYAGDFRAVLRSPSSLLALPRYLLSFRARARAVVRSFHPDVVHAHWWIPGGGIASGLRLPYVVTCHGSDVRMLDGSPLLRALARRVLAGSAAVTAVSRFLASDLERHLAQRGRDVLVTPMPVDVRFFEAGRDVPKASPPRILYAGNLVESKGVDLLVRAFALLRARGVSCGLKILGEGPAAADLRELAAAEGVLDEIVWSDLVPQSAMPGEYGAATINVLPSRGRAEGLGLSLVESLLAGTAVVGSPAGGIPEVVHDGKTGLLFRDGDWQDLGRQLERLLLQPEFRADLVETGARHVRTIHDADHCSENFLRIYRDAVR